MSKKCPKCGSRNWKTIAGFGSEVYCRDCGAEFMKRQLEDYTVFDQITASEEVLAEEFVAEFSIYGGRCYWLSLLLAEKGHSVFEQRFNTKEEAIAATVEKLKEVCDEKIR